jgi:predicted dehydrogenase
MHRIAMLGTGLIGLFYTTTLKGNRGKDQVHLVYSRRKEKAKEFADKWQIPIWTDRLEDAVSHPEIDVVVIGLPNDQHAPAARLAAEAGKAVLCTKPLARTGREAREMVEVVEKAGVFSGYLEDLVYTPKTLRRSIPLRRAHSGKYCGRGPGRPTQDHTATGSGRRRSPAAERS